MSELKIEMIGKKPKLINKKMCCEGKISINNHVEKFTMSLDSWSIDDYKKQWKQGIKKIKTNDTSCLVTNVSTLQTNPLISYWALYKVDSKIYIQNQFLGGELFKKRQRGLPPFNIETCHLYVPPRKTTNMYGDKVDEWCIDNF